MFPLKYHELGPNANPHVPRHTQAHVRHIFGHTSHEFPWNIPWYAHVFFLKSPCQDTKTPPAKKKNKKTCQLANLHSHPHVSWTIQTFPIQISIKLLVKSLENPPFIDEFPLKTQRAPMTSPSFHFSIGKKKHRKPWKPSSFPYGKNPPLRAPWLARVAGRNAPKMWPHQVVVPQRWLENRLDYRWYIETMVFNGI